MDWALAIIGITGLALAGQKRTRGYGWMVGIAVQVLWVVYALTTDQYGFLLSAFLYGAVNIVNFATWYREYSAKRQAHEERMTQIRATQIIEEERHG